MNHWNSGDYVLFGFIGLLFIVLSFIVAAGVSSKAQLQKELEADACEQTSSIPTGKRVYCGKACWRNEMKVEYSCKSGVKIVYK